MAGASGWYADPQRPGYERFNDGEKWVDEWRSVPDANTPSALAVPAQGQEPALFSIGDITLTRSRVFTPTQSAPLRGTQWSLTDETVIVKKIPTWAIVCAVVGFFLIFILSLLFLLVKQTTVTGYITVNVRGEGLNHYTRLYVTDAMQATHWRNRVAEAQRIAATA